jgi:hypothetical protein
MAANGCKWLQMAANGCTLRSLGFAAVRKRSPAFAMQKVVGSILFIRSESTANLARS